MSSVLVASPVNQHPLVLKEFAASLTCLRAEAVQADFIFIDDNADAESSYLLSLLSESVGGHIIMQSGKLPYERGMMRHQWTNGNIQRIACLRNTLMDYARDKGFDFLFMVDSDLLLHPETLHQLLAQDKEIISEIYWTAWTPGGPEFPQVWLYDNYTQYEIGDLEQVSSQEIKKRTHAFHTMLRIPGVYRVGGLGGCTLFHKSVLSSPVRYVRIPNLSFRGEDRHFCVRAAVAGFDMYVDTNCPAYHLYRMSDLAGAQSFKSRSKIVPNTVFDTTLSWNAKE